MAQLEVKGIVWAATRTYLVEPAERIVELRGLDAAGESWKRSVFQVWQDIKAGNAYFVARQDTGEPAFLEAVEARPRYVRTLPDENGRDHLVALGEPKQQLARMLGDVLSAAGLGALCGDLDLATDGSKQAKAERIADLVQTFEGLVRRLDDRLLRKMCSAYEPDFNASRVEMIEFLERHSTGELVSAVRRAEVESAPAEPSRPAARERAAPRAEPEPASAPPAPRRAITSAEFKDRLAALLDSLREASRAGQGWTPAAELPLLGFWELAGGTTRAALPVFAPDRDAARLLVGELCEWLGSDRLGPLPDVAARFEWLPTTAAARLIEAFAALRVPPRFHPLALATPAQLIEALEQASLDAPGWTLLFDQLASPDFTPPAQTPPLGELPAALRQHSPLPQARRELAERIRQALFADRFPDLAALIEAAALGE